MFCASKTWVPERVLLSSSIIGERREGNRLKNRSNVYGRGGATRLRRTFTDFFTNITRRLVCVWKKNIKNVRGRISDHAETKKLLKFLNVINYIHDNHNVVQSTSILEDNLLVQVMLRSVYRRRRLKIIRKMSVAGGRVELFSNSWSLENFVEQRQHVDVNAFRVFSNHAKASCLNSKDLQYWTFWIFFFFFVGWDNFFIRLERIIGKHFFSFNYFFKPKKKASYKEWVRVNELQYTAEDAYYRKLLSFYDSNADLTEILKPND